MPEQSASSAHPADNLNNGAPVRRVVLTHFASHLPRPLQGVRNRDYRYCWPRDATFTLYALLLAGYRDEAHAWRRWLLRAAAGRPQAPASSGRTHAGVPSRL